MTKTLADFLGEMSEHVFQDENGRLYRPIIKERRLNKDYLLVAYFGDVIKTGAIHLDAAKKHMHLMRYKRYNASNKRTNF